MFRRRISLAVVALSLAIGAPPTQAAAVDAAAANSLWVAEQDGVMRLTSAQGALLGEIRDVHDVRTVEVDIRRATVWAYAHRMLLAYDFTGQRRFTVAVPASNSVHAAIAVVPADGSVWLAVGSDLLNVSATGQVLNLMRLSANATALEVDPVASLLWVGVRSSAEARDVVSGAVTRQVPLAANSAVVGISPDVHSGRTWIAVKDEVRLYESTGELLLTEPFVGVTQVVTGLAGSVWVSTSKSVTHMTVDGGILSTTTPFEGAGVIGRLAVSGDQAVWVANQESIAHLSSAGAVLQRLSFQPPVRIRDLAVNTDAIAPELSITAPPSGACLADLGPTIQLLFSDLGWGVAPESVQVAANGVLRDISCSSTEDRAVCEFTSPLQEGQIVVAASVADYAGNISTVSETAFSIDVTPPQITVDAPAQTSQPQVTLNGSVGEAATLTFQGQAVSVGADLSFSIGPVHLEQGENVFVLETTDCAGNQSSASVTVRFQPNPGGGLPPDPALVATPLDPTVTSDIATDTAFLYAGPIPIQTGVASGAIESRRVAILRGRAMLPDGSPLSGVAVSVVGFPGLGATQSREDGVFDLAVNGANRILLRFEKAGYLPVLRDVDADWRDYTVLPDVVMTAVDAQVTSIEIGAAVLQVAQGSEVQDASGTRRAVGMFLPGTLANLVLPDGSRVAQQTLSIRATEYTVGTTGPHAMPAALPPESAYTYAVELSADEALAAGAATIEFSQPVSFYVENFLGLPVGAVVPVGYLNRSDGRWVPSKDGVIVKVLGTSSGRATLDLRGSGVAATAAELAAAGISDLEREALASLYSPGQGLWRVALPHFSAVDLNYPANPPPDAEPPPPTDKPEPADPPLETPDCTNGSMIECQNQTLGESFGVTGAPFDLVYRSDRTPGRSIRRIKVPLTGSTVPSSLKRVDVQVLVAGRLASQSFSAALNQTATVDWDGRDAYGRSVLGTVTANVRVGYVYDAIYYLPRNLGDSGSFGLEGVTSTGIRGREEVTLWSSNDVLLKSMDLRPLGAVGWSLSPRHVFDPEGSTILFGDGAMRTYRGEGVTGPLAPPKGSIVFDSGGNKLAWYVAPAGGSVVDHIAVDGTVTRIAGTGVRAYSGDGGPAVEAALWGISSVVADSGGNIYIADARNGRIRRVDASGQINTIAGSGGSSSGGLDGKPARLVALNPYLLALDPQERLFFIDFGTGGIFRLDGDRLVQVRGKNNRLSDSNLDPRSAHNFEFDVQGNLWYDHQRQVLEPNRLVVVGVDGTVTELLVGHSVLSGIHDFAVSDKGEVWFVKPTTLSTRHQLFRMNVADGSVVPSFELPPSTSTALAFDPTGSLWVGSAFGTNYFVYGRAIPEYSANGFNVPSPSADEIFVFDGRGRHSKTLHALTGGLLATFAYDSAGRLLAVTDAFGKATRLERSGSGVLTAVTSPFGQRTATVVDAAGFLREITNPANEKRTFSYASGLLTSMTDRRGNLYEFDYDANDKLTRDEDPAGGFKLLTRAETTSGYKVHVDTAQSYRTTYVVDAAGSGSKRTTVTPAGLSFIRNMTDEIAGSFTYPDGSTSTLTTQSGTRFAAIDLYPRAYTLRTPAGRELLGTYGRTETLTNPLNPFSLTRVAETWSINGRASSRVFDVGLRRYTTTSPQGRQRSLFVDPQGRIVQVVVPGVPAIVVDYDALGRISGLRQGTGAAERRLTVIYDGQGRVASTQDHLGRRRTIVYDAAGRITRQEGADGLVVTHQYDGEGNVLSVTPPGQPAHVFEYSPVSLPLSYTPPSVPGAAARITYTYNLDRQLTRIGEPDGELVMQYDTGGRLATLSVPEGVYRYEYATTGALASITTPGGELLSLSYDGFLPIQSTWSGAVSGSVQRSFDSNFWLTADSVNGSATTGYLHDRDGLLTKAGELAIVRDAATGRVSGTTIGSVATTFTYAPFGEVATSSASFQGAQVARFEYQHDGAGRIVSATETVAGAQRQLAYTYDTANRLASVSVNGSLLAEYRYDANGNRTAVIGPTGTVIAAFDAQDRLLQSGDQSFTYEPSGELRTRTQNGHTVQYAYDSLGNLRSVVFPDGVTIEYVIDGQNRRVGKKVNGGLVRGWLFGGALRPVAELDATGAVTARFVYGVSAGAPDLMIAGGVTYRFIIDHLGSVRLVLNTTTGEVVQRLTYDAFGQVIEDTQPGFQPFGFAGGIYDHQTRLVRFGARDYDPALGRWTSKDQLLFGGGTTNLYSYVHNDPINFIDRHGKNEAVLVGVGIIAILAAAAVMTADPNYQERVQEQTEELQRWWQDRPIPPFAPAPPISPFPAEYRRPWNPPRPYCPPRAYPGQPPKVTPAPVPRPADPEDNEPPTEDDLWGNEEKQGKGDKWGDFVEGVLDILEWLGGG